VVEFAACSMLAWLLGSHTALALPLYARQTGLECPACQVAYPAVTPFGRRFKLHDYTQSTGESAPSGKDGGAGERRINEAESAVVQRSFRAFADGQSPRAITKRLYDEGVPGPGGRP
jgi:hypothetical protein